MCVSVSPAEELPVQSGSAQIVVACTAAHWFDLPKFFAEVKRVLCINGVVALTAYFLPYLADEDNCEQFNACLKNVTSFFIPHDQIVIFMLS